MRREDGMRIHHGDERVTIWHGDALEVLRGLADESVDSVVTDPPYGLGFMGREWDSIKAEASRPQSADEVDERFRNVFPRTGKGPSAVAFDGIAFQQWCTLWATECLRVLKPGGHMLAFGGTRTWHRLACAVEDTGFEVRDSIAWLYGSGFPKSLDVSKAIDKRGGADIGWFGPWLREERRRRGISSNQLAKHFPSKTGGETGCVRNWELSLNLPTPEQFNTLCRVLDLPFAEIAEAEREVVGKAYRLDRKEGHVNYGGGTPGGHYDITTPATPEAERWQGWGTALKPAFEPVVVARKPLAGTVAANVLQHGTGALNIDACRVGDEERTNPSGFIASGSGNYIGGPRDRHRPPTTVAGRWPTNVVLDGEMAAELDEQSGERTSGVLAAHHTRNPKESGILGAYGSAEGERGYGDTGGASRFFKVISQTTHDDARSEHAASTPDFPTFRYEAKAPATERPRVNGTAHPTVKPLDLMRWLVRLVTPPGGTVLEPFAGSGTTVEACIVEGFHCIAIEREADYLPLIMQRVNRRRDPVAYMRSAGDDLGLFELDGEGA